MIGVGFHLPNEVAVREQTFGGTSLVVPVLSPELLSRIIGTLRERQKGLAALPAGLRVAAVAEAAGRLAAAGDQAVPSAVASTTGFSRPMVDEALARCFGAVTPEALMSLVSQGLRAFPLVGIVSAGNLPGVAVAKTVLALAAGAAVFVKTAAGEPALMPAFARELARIEPRVGEALAVAWWKGGEVALDGVLATGVDALVAYGSDETVKALGARGARVFVGYGHRASLALVRPDVDDASASAFALEVAMHDQLGCLSPQACLVLGSPMACRDLARAVSRHLVKVERLLPCGHVPEPAALAIRRIVDEIEWRQLDGDPVVVFDRGRAGRVVVQGDPVFQPGPLYRTLMVAPLESPAAFATALGPLVGRLEAVGIFPAEDDELRAAAVRAGATRVSPVGEMQRPGLDWRQGNRSPLAGIAPEPAR